MSPSAKKTPAPPSEPAASGEELGTFTAYLRRPKSLREGLMAQFFGENGPDADVITTFHLAKFLDSKVQLHIWGVKDSLGRSLMKHGKAAPLPGFHAVIHRPASTRDGLVAQFFAPNGDDADQCALLNQTRWLDALVLVQVTRGDAAEAAKAPEDDIESASRRLMPFERVALKKQQRRAHEAWKHLVLSGFFNRESLWRALGGENAYIAWLQQQPCCHPGGEPCKGQPVAAFRFEGTSVRYPMVPLCEHHIDLWELGEAVLPEGFGTELVFLENEQRVQVQRFAQAALREVLGIPADMDPTPSSIYRFALDNGLQAMLPQGFTAFFESGSAGT